MCCSMESAFENRWSVYEVVSVGPWKAAGAQQSSSLITVGLVSVMSLQCLLNISCKHQRGLDLATGIANCYVFG